MISLKAGLFPEPQAIVDAEPDDVSPHLLLLQNGLLRVLYLYLDTLQTTEHRLVAEPFQHRVLRKAIDESEHDGEYFASFFKENYPEHWDALVLIKQELEKQAA